MSNIKRRHFLQFAGSVATIGLSQLDIFQASDRYAQVLAQSTPRKLALLVGINDYGFSPLSGCINDVRLQQELLIHRFGFNPKDILTLTDNQATRSGILAAFEEHLIKQAKPGDVVVFHFSGHGARVSDKPDCDEIALKLSDECANSTLLPIDGRANLNQSGVVRDIMGHTLFLLMSALKTENVTFVLDSCHSGGGKRGNFRVRSVEGDSSSLSLPSPKELEYQRQWLSKLKLSPEEFIKLRRKAVAKGVVIASAKRDQYAVDASFNDFDAGAFTYLFTQYLWLQAGNEPVKRAIVNVGRSTRIYANQVGNYQDPEFESNFSKENTNAPIYFTRFSALPAEAVVTKVNGDRVELWLGGVDSQSLEAFTKSAIFTALDSQGKERALVKLEDRKELIGYGKLLTTTRAAKQIQPGTLLQERIRSIPNDVTLKIGLDDLLDSKTAQQATQALQTIKRIQPLPLGQQEVQYIFGRMTKAKYQELQTKQVPNLPTVDSFGLFVPTLDQIIPNSFGTAKESVSAAVTRLQPKLKSLLASRVVKQMLGNTNTSKIKVTASMGIAGNKNILSQTFPVRGVQKQAPTNQASPAISVSSLNSAVPKLPIGTQVEFQIQNNESGSIYVSILAIDAAGEMAVIFPYDWSAAEDTALIEANQKRIIPQAGDSFTLTAGEPKGYTEALIVASTTPIRNSLKALQAIARSRGLADRRGPLPSVVDDEVLSVTNNLLEDLDAGTRGGINVESAQLGTGVRAVDTSKLAAMSITFEVVAG